MIVKNVIFDFDGVIVDSEPIHIKAKTLTLDYYKIDYERDLPARFKGIPDSVFFDYVAKEIACGTISAEEMHKLKRKYYHDYFHEVKLIPGVLQFIKEIKENGIATAIASSTTTEDFHLINEHYHLSDYFEVIITKNDTIRHKPDPEPYLKAVERLQATPAVCVAIEDSPNGIKSAKSSGCRVIGLTSSFEALALIEAGADFTMDNYKDFGKVALHL